MRQWHFLAFWLRFFTLMICSVLLSCGVELVGGTLEQNQDEADDQGEDPSLLFYGGEADDVTPYFDQDYNITHYAMIYELGLELCTGIIISSDFIMTKAECVYLKNAGDLTVQTGVEGTGTQNFNVISILVHNDHDPLTTEFNMAVIQLDSAIIFTGDIQPFDIHSQDGTDWLHTGPYACRDWISSETGL